MYECMSVEILYQSTGYCRIFAKMLVFIVTVRTFFGQFRHLSSGQFSGQFSPLSDTSSYASNGLVRKYLRTFQWITACMSTGCTIDTQCS
jgi:hypothetical protein